MNQEHRRISQTSPRAIVRGRRRGFTLVEMLAVMGIIVLLVSVLVPTVITSRRKAAAARTRRDIDTIAMALEAYQQTWNSYPVFDPAAPVTVNADSVQVSIQTGDHALYTALATRGRIRAGGVPYGPFINAEQFRVDSARMQIQDKDGNLFWYLPANPAMPDIHKPLPKNGSFVDNANGGPAPLYDYAGVPWASSSQRVIPLADMQKILGDTNSNGTIDLKTAPPETAAYSGPFLLWHPGPDKKFGLQTMGGKMTTDDITNFDVPAAYRR